MKTDFVVTLPSISYANEVVLGIPQGIPSDLMNNKSVPVPLVMFTPI